MSHVETFKVKQETPSTYWSIKNLKDDLRICFQEHCIILNQAPSKKVRLIILTCSIDGMPLLSNEVLLRIHEESVLSTLPLQP